MWGFIQSINWLTVFSVGVPGAIVVLGWFYVHRLTAQRDLANRKREARLKSLERAYLRVADFSNRPALTKEQIQEFEMFVAEIQLYGTPLQITLTSELVEEFKKPNNRVSFDPILENLRDAIRTELNLERVSGPVWWLRLGTPTSSKPTTAA